MYANCKSNDLIMKLLFVTILWSSTWEIFIVSRPFCDMVMSASSSIMLIMLRNGNFVYLRKSSCLNAYNPTQMCALGNCTLHALVVNISTGYQKYKRWDICIINSSPDELIYIYICVYSRDKWLIMLLYDYVTQVRDLLFHRLLGNSLV